MIEVKGKLSLDGSGWDRTLQQVGQNTAAWGTRITQSIGAMFSVGFVTGFAREVVQAVDRIKDLSDQLGVSTDDFQKLDDAAFKAEVRVEMLAQAVGKLGAMRRKAGEGDVDAAKTFEGFGVSMADVQNSGLSNINLLDKIMGNAANMNAASQQDLVDLVGTRWGKFRALFNELRTQKGIVIIPEKDLTRIDEANKKIETLGQRIKAIVAMMAGDRMSIGGAISGAIKGVSPLGIGAEFLARFFSSGATTSPGLSTPTPTSGPLFENKAEQKKRAEDYEKNTKSLDNLFDSIDKTRLAGMNEKDRKSAITSRIQELIGAGGTNAEKIQNLSEAVGLVGQLQGLGKSKSGGMDFDSLAAIGGFSSSTGVAVASTARDNLEVSKDILRQITELSQMIREHL